MPDTIGPEGFEIHSAGDFPNTIYFSYCQSETVARASWCVGEQHLLDPFHRLCAEFLYRFGVAATATLEHVE